jgi:hypothetical protein
VWTFASIAEINVQNSKFKFKTIFTKLLDVMIGKGLAEIYQKTFKTGGYSRFTLKR